MTFAVLFFTGSSLTASAHKMPAFGHSFSPLASIVSTMTGLLALCSTRTASNQRWGLLGRWRRARSSSERALAADCFSMQRDAQTHNSLEVGQALFPCL